MTEMMGEEQISLSVLDVDCFIKGEKDPASCKRKEKLIKKHKEKIYTMILHKLVSIEFKPKTAKEIFEKTMDNLDILQRKLKRSVNIKVALLDFFINYGKKYLENPLIVEEKLFEDLQQRVLIDELTGLRNYRYYQYRIKEEIGKAKRDTQPFTIVIFDIDNFKYYNDIYGHQEGNQILKKIAQILLECVRVSDIAIRYGGDEFLVILPNTEKNDALVVAERIRKKVFKSKFKETVSISGGIATFIVDTSKDQKTLFEMADKALYMSKYKGKNKIMCYPVERRTFQRIGVSEDVKLEIKLYSDDDYRYKVEKLLDISKGGLGIQLHDRVHENDTVKGYIKKKKDELHFNGVVVWTDKMGETDFRAGIKFLNVN
ncbi:MAG: diguanylate cyclase [Spirochaetes bacterium]|nr:diguanylate cyclase [Spirochaetota bacterium]